MTRRQIVSITLDNGILNKIDKKRGKIARSIFIEDIIRKVIK